VVSIQPARLLFSAKAIAGRNANLSIENILVKQDSIPMVSRAHNVKLFTQQELLEVANYQKNILWLILISMAASLIPYATILTGIIQLYFIFSLAVAARSSAAWLYLVMGFIPLFNLLSLLHINGKATRILQSNGIRVGLMGVNPTDLKKLKLGLL
jgi:hypothetical protein